MWLGNAPHEARKIAGKTGALRLAVDSGHGSLVFGRWPIRTRMAGGFFRHRFFDCRVFDNGVKKTSRRREWWNRDSRCSGRHRREPGGFRGWSGPAEFFRRGSKGGGIVQADPGLAQTKKHFGTFDDPVGVEVFEFGKSQT